MIVESDEEMLFTFLKRKDSLFGKGKLLSSIDTVYGRYFLLYI